MTLSNISQEQFLQEAANAGISEQAALAAYKRNTSQSVSSVESDVPEIDEKRQQFFKMAEQEGIPQETAIRAYERNQERLASQEGSQEILQAEPADPFGGSLDSSALSLEAPNQWENPEFQAGRSYIQNRTGIDPVAVQTDEDLLFNRHSDKKRFVAKYKEFLAPNTSALELLSLVDGSAARELQKLNQDIAKDVILASKNKGVDLAYEAGSYYMLDEQGNKINVTPGMLETLWENKGEVVGAIGGSITGLKLGGRFGWIGALGGSILGAGAGASAGSLLDQSVQAMLLQEELQAKIALEKSLEAGKVSILTDSLFLAGFKASQITYRSLQTIFDHVKDGNKSGAIQAMKHQFNIEDDAVIDEIIEKWENLNKVDIPGDRDQKALVAVTTTQAGGENIIATTSKIDPVASASILNDVRKRAETLIDAVDKIPSEDSARQIGKAIRQYELDVDKFYDTVKSEFVDIPIPKEALPDVSQNLDVMIRRIRRSLSIDKVDEGRFLTELEPDLRASFARLQSGEATGEELLELRRVLTGLQYSKAIKDTPSKQAISTVIKQLDEATETAAKSSMGEDLGAEWLDNWKGKDGALQQYSEKLQFKDNVIYKAIIKKGFNQKSASRALISYADTVDDAYFSSNSYKEFRKNLGVKAAKEIEGQIAKDLVERHAVNNIGEVRAINFPALARDMRKFDFIDDEATKVQIVVDKLAEVYKNDAKLLKASGFVNLEQFQSYLTTNPVTRAKFWMSSKFFNYVQRVSGGGKSDARALVTLVGKFLEEPMNSKTTANLLKEVGDDIDLQKSIRTLQQTIAQEKVDGLSGTANIFKTKEGLLTTKETKTAVEKIPTHRLIPEKTVQQMYGIEKLTAKSLTSQVKKALVDQGMVAIVLKNGQIIKLL